MHVLLFIDAAASIHRCGYLFIDAAICNIDFLKFNLLSNGLIEKFWDALWLGIWLFLSFICKKIDFLKFNLLSNGLIEKFWDALWLGIGPFLCLNEETLDRAGTDAPHHQPCVGQD